MINTCTTFLLSLQILSDLAKMVEKKLKNTAMATKEERAEIKRKVTKVDPDDDDTNVHRLVQDENAKTILLNFPLEVSTTSENSSAVSNPSASAAMKPPKKPSPRPPDFDSRKGLNRIDLERGISVGGEKVKRAKLANSTSRVRSASVGRDKKSDLQVIYESDNAKNMRMTVIFCCKGLSQAFFFVFAL